MKTAFEQQINSSHLFFLHVLGLVNLKVSYSVTNSKSFAKSYMANMLIYFLETPILGARNCFILIYTKLACS